MSDRPIKLVIAALGGQGGGVLADWLVEIAETEGYIAQTTSVPGVAQRTGATIYYLEFFPRHAATLQGSEPVLALMPVPGDVDCVIASELAEAARSVQRGFVTSDRTVLIASTHRSYAIGEKSALGQGAVDPDQLVQLARQHARRLVLFDMEASAERNRSVISSVLLGALSGSGVLPFRRDAFEAAIRASGIAVAANLAAFEDAHRQAERGDQEFSRQPAAQLSTEIPERAASAPLQPLLDRVRALPQKVQPIALEGVRRTLDYQDVAYAEVFLDRIERFAAVEARVWADASSYALLSSVARSLALWMSFEDTIRVADLKTRASRFERVRAEIRAAPGQIFGITEFMKPRIAEIAGTLPAGIGRWLLRSPRASRCLGHWTGGMQVRTRTLRGFLQLHAVAGLRRWRRATLRFQEENARIEQWLDRIESLSVNHYSLAVEVARAQRLVKGYGETHERGWRSFTTLMAQLDALEGRSDGATVLASLQAAALKDEDGAALREELAALTREPQTTARIAG